MARSFYRAASPLALLIMLMAAPLVLAIGAIKRLRSGDEVPNREEYVLLPPTGPRPRD